MPRWLGLPSPAMSSTVSGTTPSHRDRKIKLLVPDRPLVALDPLLGRQRIDVFTMSRRGHREPHISHETAPSRGRLGHRGQTLSTPVSIRPRLRHDVRPEPTGWTVYDTTTGQPVCLDGAALIDLDFEEADGLARLLNWQEREIQREARRRVLAG